MAAPDNGAELVGGAGAAVSGLSFLLISIGGALWKYFNGLKKEPEKDTHVVLERAELADMNPLREFIKDFRPALEKIARIEGMTLDMKSQVQTVMEKMDRMERAAIVAKEVREELARRQDELEREHRRRNRDD